jgi:hypothetical protein
LTLYLINRFFYPDFSATSQMLTDLATGVAGEYDVTVVTSHALNDHPLAKLERQKSTVVSRSCALTPPTGAAPVCGARHWITSVSTSTSWCAFDAYMPFLALEQVHPAVFGAEGNMSRQLC